MHFGKRKHNHTGNPQLNFRFLRAIKPTEKLTGISQAINEVFVSFCLWKLPVSGCHSWTAHLEWIQLRYFDLSLYFPHWYPPHCFRACSHFVLVFKNPLPREQWMWYRIHTYSTAGQEESPLVRERYTPPPHLSQNTMTTIVFPLWEPYGPGSIFGFVVNKHKGYVAPLLTL
jgi:hypothetical protein